jgi:hypothetical protein
MKRKSTLLSLNTQRHQEESKKTLSWVSPIYGPQLTPPFPSHTSAELPCLHWPWHENTWSSCFGGFTFEYFCIMQNLKKKCTLFFLRNESCKKWDKGISLYQQVSITITKYLIYPTCEIKMFTYHLETQISNRVLQFQWGPSSDPFLHYLMAWVAMTGGNRTTFPYIFSWLIF